MVRVGFTPHNSKVKSCLKFTELDINASQACYRYKSVHPDVPDGLDCDLAEPRHSQTGVIQLVLLGCLDPENRKHLNFEIYVGSRG